VTTYERTPVTYERARMGSFCAHTMRKTRQRMSARTPPYPPPMGAPMRKRMARPCMSARVRAHTNRYLAAKKAVEVAGNSHGDKQSLLRLSGFSEGSPGRPQDANRATLGYPGAGIVVRNHPGEGIATDGVSGRFRAGRDADADGSNVARMNKEVR